MKPFSFNSNRDTIFTGNVGALSMFMNSPCNNVNGVSKFTHELVHSLILGGDLGNLKSHAFQLLKQFKKLDRLKLEHQRGAAESDMGPLWHDKIRRGLERQHPRALISFMPWTDMEDESEEDRSQEQEREKMNPRRISLKLLKNPR
jgi:hypothetical protein